jgi:hypothetical protein
LLALVRCRKLRTIGGRRRIDAISQNQKLRSSRHVDQTIGYLLIWRSKLPLKCTPNSELPEEYDATLDVRDIRIFDDQ